MRRWTTTSTPPPRSATCRRRSCWPTSCSTSRAASPRTSVAGRWPDCGRTCAACGATLGIFQRPPAAFLDGYRLRLCGRRGIDPAVVEARIAERAAARKAKDFTRGDEIRRTLQESGVELMDTPAGTTWRVTEPR